MTKIVCIMTVLVFVLVGCGVPEDEDPQVIPLADVPYDLLTPSTSQSVTTLQVPTVGQTVFMTKGDRLSAVLRTVPSPPALGTVLTTLIQGTTNAEEALGLHSFINSQASLLSASVANGTAFINLHDAFTALSLRDQILALAQCVYTATEMSGVTGVRISIDSVPVEVPRGDGSTTTDPLSRADYTQVAP